MKDDDNMPGHTFSKPYYIGTIIFIVSLFCSNLFAAGELGKTQAQLYTEIVRTFSEHQPGLPITSIDVSPIPGLYELVSEGRIYYVTKQADYIIDGNLFDVATLTNLTTKRKVGMHLDLINEIDESEMIVYQPKQPVIGTVTVFTDSSCPYCQKLHAEIDVMLEAGVKVRYMLYPRAGIDSDAFVELRSVWCADDRGVALTRVKRGESIALKSCDNPIAKHMKVAQNVDLVGTPLLYLDNGEMVAGYQSAGELIDRFRNSAN